mgnify:CR=1 FL=1
MTTPLFRGLITGYPGAGKTSSLASIANAGFKLRILDFDGNPESVIQYTKPELRGNIDVISFEDKLAMLGGFIGVAGIPNAFPAAFKALDDWRYEDADGEADKTGKKWISLGSSRDWGSDTVVVLDGLTGLSSAAMAHARAILNKTPLNTTRACWGLAAANVEAFISRLTSMQNKHHVVVISHLKIIGPEGEQDGDSDFTKELKEAKAGIIPTRLFPSAIGRQLPQNVAGHFPVVIAAEAKAYGGKVRRVLVASARPDQDTKLPIADLDKLGDLPIETGLWDIFQALGVKAP